MVNKLEHNIIIHFFVFFQNTSNACKKSTGTGNFWIRARKKVV